MINTFLHLKMCWQQKCYRNFIWRLSATNTPLDLSGVVLAGSKVHREEKGGRRRIRKNKKNTQQKHLLCNSRELEDVEGFVVHGGALVDVDDHAGFAAAAEETLQVVGQLALPERNVLR